MYVRALRVTHVRSVAHADVQLARDFTWITGPNGAGKTNLLEAVHLCSTLRPLTTHVPAELVAHGQARAVVEGVLEGGVLPLDVKVTVEAGRRRAWVAGKPLRDAEAYTGTLPTVSFTPDDLTLIKQGPGVRRAFLSRAAQELWPAARDELRRLERCLRQRAAAFRRGAAPAVVAALEEPLVDACVHVWRRRQAALTQVLPRATSWLAQLMDGRSMTVLLNPGLPQPVDLHQVDDAALAHHLRQALHQNGDEDARRATTSAGPQHDDLTVLLQGQDARRFASQGQQRCCALALTLGVVDAVHQARGRPPLVLLDDVSSELDAQRRAALFAALAQSTCQVVATATDRALLPVPAAFGGEVWAYIAQGGQFERDPTP